VPVVWTLLGAAAALLLLPLVELLVAGSEPGVDTQPLRALGVAWQLTGFPLVVLPLLAVVLARGSAVLERVGAVAALEYGVALLAGTIGVVVTVAGELTHGWYGGSLSDLPRLVLTEVVELVLVGVALFVTVRLSRRPGAGGAA
jgi:hypothetical protein